MRYHPRLDHNSIGLLSDVNVFSLIDPSRQEQGSKNDGQDGEYDTHYQQRVV